MEENTENSNVENNAEKVVITEFPSSGYGLVSVIIGAVFFGSMIVFAFNVGIITMTSETGILETGDIVSILYSYLTTGGPGSVVGIAFGVAGFMQKDRSKFLPCWGLVLNFINLNGAIFALVTLNLQP